MSGAIHSNFSGSVPHGELAKCIAYLEGGLRSLQETPYHAILGRDYLQHTEAAADFILAFFRKTTQKFPVAVLYFEMNGFTINPDRWYFDGFAYRAGGNIWDLTWNTQWLSGCDASTSEGFTLTGLEPVQQAFTDVFMRDDQGLGVHLATEIAEHLVVARFDELMGAAVAAARKLEPKLQCVPALATAHEWDVLFPIE
jgi:hypothetical protein